MRSCSALMCAAAVLAAPAPAQAATEYAFAWADQAFATGWYTPNLSYQSTSNGTEIQILRVSEGVYDVWVPPHMEGPGHVQVSAYGSAPVFCKPGWWFRNDWAIHSRVRCFDLDGDPADSRFSFLYVDYDEEWPDEDPYSPYWPYSTPYDPGVDLAPRAMYLFADQPTSWIYDPHGSYRFDSEGTAPWIERLSVGRYVVHIDDPSQFVGRGAVLVQSYGDSPTVCGAVMNSPYYEYLGYPSYGVLADPFVDLRINCRNTDNEFVDDHFVLLAVRDAPVIPGNHGASFGFGHYTGWINFNTIEPDHARTQHIEYLPSGLLSGIHLWGQPSTEAVALTSVTDYTGIMRICNPLYWAWHSGVGLPLTRNPPTPNNIYLPTVCHRLDGQTFQSQQFAHHGVYVSDVPL